MKNILGLMVFHRPFEVSERFQRDHVDSSILEFCCYPYALLSKASGEVFQQSTREHVFILSRKDMSMATSLSESLRMGRVLPFSGVTRTLSLLKSGYIHLRDYASTGRMPVSLNS
jgi:hypothetical protein